MSDQKPSMEDAIRFPITLLRLATDIEPAVVGREIIAHFENDPETIARYTELCQGSAFVQTKRSFLQNVCAGSMRWNYFATYLGIKSIIGPSVMSTLPTDRFILARANGYNKVPDVPDFDQLPISINQVRYAKEWLQKEKFIRHYSSNRRRGQWFAIPNRISQKRFEEEVSKQLIARDRRKLLRKTQQLQIDTNVESQLAVDKVKTEYPSIQIEMTPGNDNRNTVEEICDSIGRNRAAAKTVPERRKQPQRSPEEPIDYSNPILYEQPSNPSNSKSQDNGHSRPNRIGG